jgi:hypothetical protein
LNGFDEVGMDVNLGRDAFLAEFFEALALFDLAVGVGVFCCPSAKRSRG